MSHRDIDSEFGTALKTYRVNSAVSQDELAAKMRSLGFSLSQATIGKIERGERKVTVGEALALAEALGLSPLALTEATAQLPGDLLFRRLSAQRSALKERMADYESDLSFAAHEANALEAPSAELRHILLEPLEDVVAEYRRETTADETEARRRKEESLGAVPRRDHGGIQGERERKFGATVYRRMRIDGALAKPHLDQGEGDGTDG